MKTVFDNHLKFANKTQRISLVKSLEIRATTRTRLAIPNKTNLKFSGLHQQLTGRFSNKTFASFEFRVYPNPHEVMISA